MVQAVGEPYLFSRRRRIVRPGAARTSGELGCLLRVGMHAQMAVVRDCIEIGVDLLRKDVRVANAVVSVGEALRQCRRQFRPHVRQDVILVEDARDVGDDRFRVHARLLRW